MSGPAEEHRRVAGAFTITVEGVALDAWDRPAPVEGWVARDVVRHLTTWFPSFLESGTGITLRVGPSVDDDPVGAWRSQTDAVQQLLDDDESCQREYDLPHMGRMTLGSAIDMIYTNDVFLHHGTWPVRRVKTRRWILSSAPRCWRAWCPSRSCCVRVASTVPESVSPTTRTSKHD